MSGAAASILALGPLQGRYLAHIGRLRDVRSVRPARSVPLRALQTDVRGVIHNVHCMTSPPPDPQPRLPPPAVKRAGTASRRTLTYRFSRSNLLFRREGKPQRLPVHQNGTPPEPGLVVGTATSGCGAHYAARSPQPRSNARSP